MKNLTKKDAYQTITDQIIAGMETLKGDWKASWAKRGLPINAQGESYNGLNIIVLFMAAHVNGFNHNEWGTYNAWKKRGGNVRKGQKATARVIRWVQINEKVVKLARMDFDLKKQCMIQKTIDQDEAELIRAPHAAEIDELRRQEAEILKLIIGAQSDLKGEMAFEDY